MAKNFSDENENEKNIDEQSETENAVDTAKEEKPILPRKRKIVKNVQLPIVLAIFAVALLSVIVWKMFFDQSIVGEWYYIAEGEYVETLDSPIESEDEASITHQYSQRVVYDFREDGVCVVTLGTTSVEGSYDLYSSADGNVLSAYVVYQYTPLLYGSFNYKVTGNVFTGRKLVLSDVYGEGYELVLEPGEGESPLEAYEDVEIEERLIGTWRDENYGITFEIKSDGFMVCSTDDGLIIEYAYTKFEEGTLLLKSYGDSEQAQTYTYSFDGDKTYINGSEVNKIK